MDGMLNEYRITQAVIRLMIIFLLFPLHEYAHAWAAYKLGDDTAKINGRLTLSPFAHVDVFGALLLLFTGFGWAKPVPVDSSRFRNPRKGMMLTSLAGPLVNLIAAFAGVIAAQILLSTGAAESVMQSGGYGSPYMLLSAFININLNLFVFNMLPIPPLDGSKILIYLLPRKQAVWFIRHQQGFYYVMLILMATGLLSIPISILSGLLYFGMDLATSWIPMLMV